IYGFGDGGRWVAIADPKGEYTDVADRLGLDVVRLSPGGSMRVNSLDDGPGAAAEPDEQRTLRRAEMVTALAATVLARPLSQLEDAAIFAAVQHLGRQRGGPTLPDLAALLTAPPAALAAQLRRRAAALVDELGPL